MWPNPHFSADLVTFTEEILNGKPHFLCRDSSFIKGDSWNRQEMDIFTAKC